MHSEPMTFTADTATYDVIEGAHIAGLAIGSGDRGYLMFQRSGKSGSDDFGIYLELNDQSNSGYELIQTCTISRDEVVLGLNQPLADIVAIRVNLSIDDEAFRKFVSGMKEVFRGRNERLSINA